jgi:hypothetical protein
MRAPPEDIFAKRMNLLIQGNLCRIFGALGFVGDFMRGFGLVLLAAVWALPVAADEISDALQAAQDAYAAGDMRTAAAQVTVAQTSLQARQSALLEEFLPEAPAGFTRVVNTEFAAGFSMFGGGVGAEASYTGEAGAFTVNLMADNQMVTGMAEMFMNPEMLAMMGKVVTVGEISILDQGESVTALVAGRLLITAQGMGSAEMLPVVQAIDFDRLAVFDQ